MWRDKLRLVRDYLAKNIKIILPVAVILVVALGVSLALGIDDVEDKMDENMPESSVEQSVQSSVPENIEEEPVEEGIPEVPLVANEIPEMFTLMCVYFDALANSNVETIQSISNYVEDTEAIRIRELGKYIEVYPLIEVYTKEGPVDGSYIAYVYYHVKFTGHEAHVPGLMTFYVCTDAEGKLYLNEGETDEEILEYVRTVSLQEDVVELTNKTNAGYNELIVNDKTFEQYMIALEAEVGQATGEALAAQIAQTQEDAQESTAGGETSGTQEGSPETQQPSEASLMTDFYAIATTTVNVRVSASEQADKLGKLLSGNRVQVKEQLANGWSKVVFENKEGYIKSEYLQQEVISSGETGSGTSSSGTGSAASGNMREAKASINMRKTASTGSEKLCVIPGGEMVELMSENNGWSQIRYKDKVGFVKSEYLQ